MNPRTYHLKNDVSCEASVNFQHISQNATPAAQFARDPALTMRFAKHMQHDMSAPATRNDDGGLPSAAPATKNATHLLKTTPKYCACHTRRLLTHFETCWNVTKCHSRHATRGYATFETSKSDRFCRTRHRHGHTVLTDGCGRLRTVADGCGWLRTVANGCATFGERSLNPQTEPLLCRQHPAA